MSKRDLIKECYPVLKLEYWITFFGQDGDRKTEFIGSVELKISADEIKRLLLADTASKSPTMCSAEDVKRETLLIIKSRGLSLENCRFIMTDNCNAMLGQHAGFVKLMKEHMPYMNETIGGCACHLVNLITKSVAVSSPMFKDTVAKITLLHKKIKKNPIIANILKISEDLLEVNSLGSFCKTRFLSLYRFVVQILAQFNLLIRIMRTRAKFAILNDWLTDKTTPVILDQFAQILKPLYHLNIALQSSSLTAGEHLLHIERPCVI